MTRTEEYFGDKFLSEEENITLDLIMAELQEVKLRKFMAKNTDSFL